jgi:hypothetical protein
VSTQYKPRVEGQEQLGARRGILRVHAGLAGPHARAIVDPEESQARPVLWLARIDHHHLADPRGRAADHLVELGVLVRLAKDGEACAIDPGDEGDTRRLREVGEHVRILAVPIEVVA